LDVICTDTASCSSNNVTPYRWWGSVPIIKNEITSKEACIAACTAYSGVGMWSTTCVCSYGVR
jgi:hypothetical protein